MWLTGKNPILYDCDKKIIWTYHPNYLNRSHLKEESLNKMIYLLFKKEILTHQTKSYAHTIKAFGNRVAHPSIKQPIIFTSKDALLVLSTLVTLLEILKTQNLLVGLNSVK